MTPLSPPGLLFIVNSLELGGAEKQVVTLLNHLDADRFRLHLAYLKPSSRLLPPSQRSLQPRAQATGERSERSDKRHLISRMA